MRETAVNALRPPLSDVAATFAAAAASGGSSMPAANALLDAAYPHLARARRIDEIAGAHSEQLTLGPFFQRIFSDPPPAATTQLPQLQRGRSTS